MDNTTDILQIKIAEARAGLSKESRAAIDDVDWKFILLGMNKKYNSDQLENLVTETELLLCGILNPDQYENELEKRIMLPKEDIISLLNDVDRLVFKKIQEALEKRIEGNGQSMFKGPQAKIDKIISVNEKALLMKKTSDLDPRFGNMPRGVQEAIGKSNWKEKLYEISKRYKINIEQMGILEETTSKVISNEIHPDKYESELSSEINIAREDISNMVRDVNENILKKIKVIMETQSETPNKEENIEIPLPPYAKEINNEELIIKNEGGNTQEEPNITVIPKSFKPVEEIIPQPPKNIMEEKLQGTTVSEHTVSDHSIPKTLDPYREAF